MAGDWSAEELQGVLYLPEVEKAIQEVFPSNDPLDAIDFDVTDYINKLFPTEQSLAGVDDTLKRMKIKINSLDEEIRTVVREQAESGHDGRVSLEEAQTAIGELFGRIQNIKDKAEHSELMVKKITGDIKQLDIAKKHLMDSIRTLEKLRLFVTNLEEIE
jgi:archaellum component FlaC